MPPEEQRSPSRAKQHRRLIVGQRPRQ